MSGAVDCDNHVTAPGAGHVSLPRFAILRVMRALIFTSFETSGSTIPSGLSRQLFDPAMDVVALGNLALGDDGLGLDSLARIEAAAAVARFFGMERSGRDDYLLVSDRLGDWADLAAAEFSDRGPAAELTFQTSGSSDYPSAVTHSVARLTEEADTFSATLFESEPCRVVSLVPPHHIYGFLFTCLYPALLNCPVIDLSHRPSGAVHRLVRSGDLVVGTPFNWRMVVSNGKQVPDTVTGVVSAGPAPPDLWSAAEAANFCDLVEIYGATETGGLAWRRSGTEPFRLFPHLIRMGDGVGHRETGQACLLQDHLCWHAERSFSLKGRRDKAVQIAGVNVSLSRVRVVLERVEGIAEVAVRLDGDSLKAFLVPQRAAIPHADLIDAVASQAKADLPGPARPRRYVVGSELPRNVMGKLSDWSEGTTECHNAGQRPTF